MGNSPFPQMSGEPVVVVGGYIGGAGGYHIGETCGRAVNHALSQTPLPKGAIDASSDIVAYAVKVPSVVTGVALGVALGGTADLLTMAGRYGTQKIGNAVEELGNTLDTMQEKRAHAGKRGQTSEGIAQMPDEAAPFLIALAVARRARIISEEEAFERASAFAVKCAVEEFSPDDALENAEAAGRELLTYVKLSECFPKDAPEILQETARALAEEDPEACDAAWIVCGSKPLSEWSEPIRKSLPKSAVDLSPDLLTRALHAKFKEVKPSLVESLQRLCPGGEDNDYDPIVSKFYETMPSSSFWKVWQLLERKETSDVFNGLTYDQLASPTFMYEFQKALNAKAASDKLANAQQKDVQRSLKNLLRNESKASKDGEVRVEILRVESLKDPEYRVGDMTSSLFGAVGLTSQTMHPYVEVEWGAIAHQSRTVDIESDGNADVGESFCWSFVGDDLNAAVRRNGTISFRAFDARGAQAAVRGDPLFGIGNINIDEKMLLQGSVLTVKLKRGGENHGDLKIRLSSRVPQPELELLTQSKSRPLALVLKVIAYILSLKRGLNMLVETRPLPTQGVDKDCMIAMLTDWAQQFTECVDRLDPQLSDKDTMKHMASMSASVQLIVSACVPAGTSASQVMCIGAQWIRSFCATAATWIGETDKAAAQEMAEIDERRLMQVLQLGSKQLKQQRSISQISLKPAVPAYWRNQSLKQGEQIKVRTRELDDVFLKKLLQTATHLHCAGRDGTFNIDDIMCVRSYRLENTITWTQYTNKVKELRARFEAAGSTCSLLQPPVPRHMYLDGAEYDETMNEVFLWHATKYDIVDTIINEGFDERVCSLGGLFGAGVYFAEESCKSGQYAKKHHGKHYFFFSRVLLGRPHYAKTSMNSTRRAPEGSDCVIANVGSACKLGHRELIVYDRFQAYPEFLIEATTSEASAEDIVF